MSEKYKENLEWMAMGVAIGVMVGYVIGMVMANTIWL
jgi:hypothetical protein|tara:strand:+ start:4410 stop:4520 length:111 start_codon:yes stop_codon:yes gene_type:complete